MMEILCVGITLVICGLGVAWLIYDVQNQIKTYEERCESLEEKEEE